MKVLKNNISKNTMLIMLVFSFFTACTETDKRFSDTPTSGEINISADQSLEPIVDAELQVFHGHYKHAKINPFYAGEGDAMDLLLKDSVRVAVVTRELTQEEKEYFKKIKITPRTTKIAYDALAIIAHNSNTDTNLTYNQVRDIFSGKISNWKDINKNSYLGEIRVIFDNKSSSTARFVKEKFLNNSSDFPSNTFATNTNKELVDYVEKNKNSIGIIGVNWISDLDDPSSIDFLKRIKVIAISPPDTAKGAGEFYKPYQAYIAQKIYPLSREVYIVSREARTGLGSGFAAFVAGDKGQRIILKSALVPATAPIRLVSLGNNN